MNSTKFKIFIISSIILLAREDLNTHFLLAPDFLSKNQIVAAPHDDIYHQLKNSASDFGNNPENTNWYSDAIEQIKAKEYEITFNEEIKSFQSPNRANNLRFTYFKNGFTVSPRITNIPLFDLNDKFIGENEKRYKKIDEWKICFTLKNVSRASSSENNSLNPENSSGDVVEWFDLSGEKIFTDRNKAYIENDKLRINYLNNEEGMRQDFIIKEKPEGNGILRINLSVETELKMVTGGDALCFKDKFGNEKMKYKSLKAWDAKGKDVRAYFECANIYGKFFKGNKKNFSIAVNDNEAVYPLTIDPLSTVANWTSEINQANASFGINVSTAGDVNGDGYSEVIIGANTFDGGQFLEGAVFVYNGAASGPSASPDWTAESNQAFAEFGNDCGTAGDVNGDGYSDVLAGSYRYDNGQTDEGAAFIWYGSAAGLGANGNPSNADWTAESNQAGALFGISVSTAGNVNYHTGQYIEYSDVLIGAYLYDSSPFTDCGAAFLWYGSASGPIPNGTPSNANWNIVGTQNNEGLGSSVSLAGDVDSDGRGDFIIGSYNYTNTFQNEGKAMIFRGIYFGQTQPSLFWTGYGGSANANFGVSVSLAGDVNCDLYSDVIVGAYHFTNGEFNEGKISLFKGNPGSFGGMSQTPSWSVEGGQADAALGISVSTAGDVNGDGYADVIAGAYLYNNTLTDEGRAYIYFGNSTTAGLSLSPNWIVDGGQVNAQFGYSVSTAGDVNGDGISDVITGAPYYDNGQTDEGRAFVFLGSPGGLSLTSSWSRIGAPSNQINTDFGRCVALGGDINGDGYSEALIGAPYYDNGTNKTGRVFILAGSSTGFAPSSFGVNFIPPSGNFQTFGYSLSSAGDINGDGYGDVIVGAPYNTNPETSEGKVYVYYGSSLLTNISISSWTFEENQANSFLGWSVAAAGDVNGDGYSDVLAGAYRYSNGESDEGRVYLFMGSASGLSASPSWTGESNTAFAQYGTSVSGAGDVNGDGYNDVLIGAPNFNWTTTGGRVYLYYGSSSPNGLNQTSPDWTSNLGTAFSQYGISVACAGDVDGSGIADIVIGANYYFNGHLTTGKVFVFYGFAGGLNPTPWTYTGGQNNPALGTSVSTAGDVNCDGYSDIAVGEPLYDNGLTNRGRVSVFHGSSSGLSASPDWTAEGYQANENLGISVSSAGDVNGDSYSDIIAGASGHTSGADVIGAAYSYYGNEGISKNNYIRQFKPYTFNVVYNGGYTGSFTAARFALQGRSPMGKTIGKIVYETGISGQPFSSGSNFKLTNSTSYTGTGINQTIINGSGSTPNLYADATGLSFFLQKETKWRARIEYKLTSNPLQHFGPWRYYTNYLPLPNWSLRPTYHSGFGFILNLGMYIEGFYKEDLSAMSVSDTVKINLRRAIAPYDKIDSSTGNLSELGTVTLLFPNINSPDSFFVELRHRNGLYTWSSGLVRNDSVEKHYEFDEEASSAFGNNMKQVNVKPLTFAIYSGDVNQDGVIDGDDGLLIDNDAAIFNIGYLITDLNGDEFIDGNDAVISDNNAADFIAAIRP